MRRSTKPLSFYISPNAYRGGLERQCSICKTGGALPFWERRNEKSERRKERSERRKEKGEMGGGGWGGIVKVDGNTITSNGGSLNGVK